MQRKNNMGIENRNNQLQEKNRVPREGFSEKVIFD